MSKVKINSRFSKGDSAYFVHLVEVECDKCNSHKKKIYIVSETIIKNVSAYIGTKSECIRYNQNMFTESELFKTKEEAEILKDDRQLSRDKWLKINKEFHIK